MKFLATIHASLLALIGLFSALPKAEANLPYASGDLLLGVRASADPGSTQDYVLDLGPVSQFTGATAPLVVAGEGNVAADLAIFSDPNGAPWSSRSDVSWGIIGTDSPSDPANTLYASRPRTDVNMQTAPWQRRANSGQSATNSTIRAFISGYKLSNANAASPKGAIQSTSSANSYSQFTSGGTDFGFFSGLEGNFGAGTAGSVLDLYRLTPTTQNAAGPGLVYVGTFQIGNGGVLTFTPAPPTFILSSGAYAVAEDGGTVTVQIQRTGLISSTGSVQFDTSDGDGVAGTDYTAKAGFIVNFPANQNEVDVPVSVINRAGTQASRTFNVTLSNPSGGSLSAPSTAIVTINDAASQTAGQIAFSAATYSGFPKNNHAAPNTIEVSLVRTGGSSGAVSANVSVLPGGTLSPGTDFTFASPTTVSFSDGETSKVVELPLDPLDDAKLPGTIKLSVSNLQGGATVGTISTATVSVNKADKANPTLAITSKAGKVTLPSFELTGAAGDNADIDRVEVKVNGGSVQLATLGALSKGHRTLDLSGIALENGNNSIVVTAFDSSGNATKPLTIIVNYGNSRPALAGTYNGLLLATQASTNDNNGYVNLTITSLGLFTGKVTIGLAVLPIVGIFDNAGVAHFNATGPTLAAPTALALSRKAGTVTSAYGSLGLSIAPDRVTGTLTDSSTAVVANLKAERAFFDGKTPATTVAANYLVNKGAYTVIFPAQLTESGLASSDYPQGDGYGLLKVASNGIVTLTGTLADGTTLSASAPLSKTYEWPFFAKLYKSQGLIAGPVQFDDTQADGDLKGSDLLWVRPALPGKYYPNGWPAGILTGLLGAKYANIAGASVLPGLSAPDPVSGNATLQFTDGGLAAPIPKTVNITTANKISNAPADKTFSLAITAATGKFSGKFLHSDKSSPAFNGAIFQKGSAPGGFGFFLSTVPAAGPSGQSGAVTLHAK